MKVFLKRLTLVSVVFGVTCGYISGYDEIQKCKKYGFSTKETCKAVVEYLKD